MNAAHIFIRTRRAAAIAFAAALAAIAIVAIAAPRANALEIKRMRLADGAILLVSEEHQLPMVTVSIAFDAGGRRDPKGKAGLAVLTASCMNQGTKTIPAAEFNQKADFMGSSVGVSAGRDYAVASMTSLKKYEKQTLALLAGILTGPGLRTADIERKRAQQIANIKSNQEQPDYVADVDFIKTLFGAGTPYGHPQIGTAKSVAKLTPADVREFYREHYKTGGAVIAVVGDVSAENVKALLEHDLAGLSGSVAPQAPPPPPEAPRGLQAKLIDRNVRQANIIMGFGGIARANPDYYKIQVMNYILGGGGFASRLMKVVRTQHGLAYSIGSLFDARKFPGPFAVVLQTKNRSSNEAIKLVLEQLHEMRRSEVSPTEIASAKKYLIGSFPIKLDRQSAIAGFLLGIQLDHLGLNYADNYPKLIGAVTRQDVLQVARKYLHPDSILLVAVADQKEAAINTKMLAQVAAEKAAAQ